MVNMDKNNIVYIQINTWYDSDLSYLQELEDGKHDNEINYSQVWYDMAIVYCITTTEEYAKKHNLMKHKYTMVEHRMFNNYFPKYDPNNFGCWYCGEYEGWAPYKDFNKELEKAVRQKFKTKEDNS